jgi:uncharacterized membrane protein YkoI
MTANIFAQSISQGNVPAVVLNAFQQKLPDAEDVKWKLSKGTYLVRCEVNGKDHKLTLDGQGKILKHAQDLYASEIPANILATIQSKVAYFDLDDADRYEEEGNIIYEINFKIDGKKHHFLVSDKGRITKFKKDLKESEIPATMLDLIQTGYGTFDLERSRYLEESGKSMYILKGEINDYDHTFIFDQKSNIIEHHQDLRHSEIPVPVLNAIKDLYSGFEIRDADLTEAGGKATYRLKMKKSNETIYVSLNKTGKILLVE